MDEKVKVSHLWIIVDAVLFALALCGAGAGLYYHAKYNDLRNTVEAARAGELQRQLSNVTIELERTKTSLAESEQSVGRLEEIDRRRDAGIERIERSLDATGSGIRNAQGGNAVTEAALRGIKEISYILEEEFGGSPK